MRRHKRVKGVKFMATRRFDFGEHNKVYRRYITESYT